MAHVGITVYSVHTPFRHFTRNVYTATQQNNGDSLRTWVYYHVKYTLYIMRTWYTYIIRI